MITIFDHIRAANGAAKDSREHFNAPIVAGNHLVSIQCHGFAYCRPRVAGLPLESYEKIELAIWPVGQHLEFSNPRNTQWLAPFSGAWGRDDVAAYITWETAQAIVDACIDNATTETQMESKTWKPNTKKSLNCN